MTCASVKLYACNAVRNHLSDIVSFNVIRIVNLNGVFAYLCVSVQLRQNVHCF